MYYFCGLTNKYIRILVHRLNNPVFVLLVIDNVDDRDCSKIELPRLSLDGNRFGPDEIRSILHTFLQSFNSYYFISNISSY